MSGDLDYKLQALMAADFAALEFDPAVMDGQVLWLGGHGLGYGTSRAFDGARRNDGTLTGMSLPSAWVPTPVGAGWAFDAVNDRILAGDIAGIHGSPAVTVAGWFWCDSIKDFNFFASKGAYNAGCSLYSQSAANSLAWNVRTSGGANEVQAAGFTAGRLSHVTGTYQNGAGLRLFQDGRPLSTTTMLGPAAGTVSAAGNVSLGNTDPTNASFWLAGRVSDVRLYSRALPPSVIQSLADRSLPWCRPADDVTYSFPQASGGVRDIFGRQGGVIGSSVIRGAA